MCREQENYSGSFTQVVKAYIISSSAPVGNMQHDSERNGIDKHAEREREDSKPKRKKLSKRVSDERVTG